MADPNGNAEFLAVEFPPGVETPNAVVEFLLAELIRVERLPAGAAVEVAQRVWQRERLGSTAIGRGVALPHARCGMVASVVGAIGRCSRPINWPGSLDGKPVGVVCLLVVPDGPSGSGLRELERVVRQLRGDESPGGQPA